MPISGTTTTSSADVLSAQIEKVRGSIEELCESTSEVAQMFEKSSVVEKISEQLYRIPLARYVGGTFGIVDGNGGNAMAGSGPLITHMTAGFKYSDLAYAWSLQSEETAKGGETSAVNLVEFIMNNAMKQLGAYRDILAHNDGTGKITNGASAGSANSLTFASSTDALKVRNLREGMVVSVYDSSASGFMTGTYTISAINYATKAVTFSTNLSATGASGDYIVIAGISDNPPVSFSANYPASSLTADSSRHGIQYFNDATSSNYVLGILKSTVPQLLPSAYAAASTALTFDMGQIIVDGLQQRRDPDVIRGTIGIFPQAQASRVMSITAQMSNKFITDSKIGKSVDAWPDNNTYQDKFEFCGFTCMRSKRQPSDRVDFINPSKWGRAEVRPADFLSQNGKYIFEGRNSSGGVKFTSEIHIVEAFDYFTVDPGAGASITGLPYSTDY